MDRVSASQRSISSMRLSSFSRSRRNASEPRSRFNGGMSESTTLRMLCAALHRIPDLAARHVIQSHEDFAGGGSVVFRPRLRPADRMIAEEIGPECARRDGGHLDAQRRQLL